MNKEKISIIVPVYNVEKYLGECLDSILAQTYENIEVITVNDGSTDDSDSVLQAYAEKDARIRVIQKKNGGLSDARNEGLKYINGRYVCFIDSDDVIGNEYIARLYDAMIKEDAEVAVCDMEYFYEDGSRKQSDGGQFHAGSIVENPELILMNNSACNKLFRFTLLKDTKFPVGKWYEDLATVPILLYKAKRIVKVNEPLYFYRQRSGSIAHSTDLRIFDIYDAIDRVLSYVQSHGNEQQIVEAVCHMYVIHGLDLTTLRIKDFDDRNARINYLKMNMERLQKHDPQYRKDSYYQSAAFKKKLIYFLLAHGKYKEVLRIYDK